MNILTIVNKLCSHNDFMPAELYTFNGGDVYVRYELEQKEEFNEFLKKSEYNESGVYTVYSYGYHFPMYVFKDLTWYENSDKYSVSTSKQQTQMRPNSVTEFKLKNTEQLKRLI